MRRCRPGAGANLGDLGSITISRSNLIKALQRNDLLATSRALQAFFHNLPRNYQPARELNLWSDDYKKFVNAIMQGDLETARQIWGVELLPLSDEARKIIDALVHIRNVLAFPSSDKTAKFWTLVANASSQGHYETGSMVAKAFMAWDAPPFAPPLSYDGHLAAARNVLLSLAEALNDTLTGAARCAPPTIDNLEKQLWPIMLCATCQAYNYSQNTVLDGTDYVPQPNALWEVLAQALFHFGACSSEVEAKLRNLALRLAGRNTCP